MIRANATRYCTYVRADLFADVGHLVHEGDLGGEESVGRVFNQLRRRGLGDDHGYVAIYQYSVEFLHHFFGGATIRADHDTIGFEEIRHRAAFTKELGIRYNRYFKFRLE